MNRLGEGSKEGGDILEVSFHESNNYDTAKIKFGPRLIGCIDVL